MGILIQAVPAHAEDPALISFGAGQFDQSLIDPGFAFLDVSEHDAKNESLDLRAEYRFATPIVSFFDDRAHLRPFVGLEAMTDGSFYGLGGVFLDVKFGHFYISPSFGAGLYAKGSGKDLGSPVEFRSQLELGWAFDSGYRVGLAYSHISNADLSSVNPGANVIGLYLHTPASVF